jgi:hypothetical protein
MSSDADQCVQCGCRCSSTQRTPLHSHTHISHSIPNLLLQEVHALNTRPHSLTPGPYYTNLRPRPQFTHHRAHSDIALVPTLTNSSSSSADSEDAGPQTPSARPMYLSPATAHRGRSATMRSTSGFLDVPSVQTRSRSRTEGSGVKNRERSASASSTGGTSIRETLEGLRGFRGVLRKCG